MKQAKQYFEHDSKVELLYFTSDSLAFFDEQNAINHAKQLDDPTITSMTREEAEQAADELASGLWEDELFDELDEQ